MPTRLASSLQQLTLPGRTAPARCAEQCPRHLAPPAASTRRLAAEAAQRQATLSSAPLPAPRSSAPQARLSPYAPHSSRASASASTLSAHGHSSSRSVCLVSTCAASARQPQRRAPPPGAARSRLPPHPRQRSADQSAAQCAGTGRRRQGPEGEPGRSPAAPRARGAAWPPPPPPCWAAPPWPRC
jgi:hypothetical protein